MIGATLTFGLEGTECAACFYSVSESVRRVDGISKIVDVTGLGSRARITFDPNKTTAHRIAHAVWRAVPLHGRPYQATLEIHVPDYAKNGNAARIDALLADWKQWITHRILDRKAGTIAIRFLPLSKSERRSSNPGLGHITLLEALRAPPPRGLGIDAKLPASD